MIFFLKKKKNLRFYQYKKIFLHDPNPPPKLSLKIFLTHGPYSSGVGFLQKIQNFQISLRRFRDIEKKLFS